MDLKTAFTAAALAYYSIPNIDDGLAMRELENIYNTITNKPRTPEQEEKLTNYLAELAVAVNKKNLDAVLYGTNILKFQD